ncbi:VCBS repeat-containing protein [Poritiphilus flavus]|uniref:RNA-binding protein n=1 Tax=Poritiphilus flavus TaxID=2697053 RepID=A0A6L9E7V4_9FLAO|nr:VCBS repeat-containing protein [Poritiphilus flavus]NAS10780.1 RNA-binding protein [Poritiphilus flavus]
MKKLTPLYLLALYAFCCIQVGCRRQGENTKEDPPDTVSKVFTLLSPEETNVHFQNQLKESLNANVLVYEYLYNGGGVAAADFNGDALVDLYFTSNMGENKLYINEGGLKFKEVTASSGVSGRPGPWKTGITAADVNGDGRLDLYLCYSGALPPAKRQNQLFINTGNKDGNIPVFEDQAAKYGLDSPAFSNQAHFFDYDQDGDLDALLLNHNPKSLPILNVAATKEFLKKDDPLQGVRLYAQQNGTFKDVTQEAGISGSALTYGLGLGISDIDNDGWQDFYVSNDYAVPDYLYMNNGDGTFTDRIKESMGHISHFSMGNDIADINNDGFQDIITLDMLPEDNRRQKLLLSPDNYDKFDLNVRSGFHYQYMRNMLQLNNGNGTFSELGQLAGISNTDWSWVALLADYDNDGLKDLFVTNGYFRDYTNLDFINYMDNYVKSKGRLQRTDVLEIIEEMPSSNVTNYLFSNQNGTLFSDKTAAFGLDQPSNSNGAAYADLDNDGDLDLIVNNINKAAAIYRNNSSDDQKNYLQIALKGEKQNTQGLGSKVVIHHGGQMQKLEQMPTRGYLSTVSSVLHFGLGNSTKIDSLRVQWPGGKKQTLVDISANQKLQLEERNAEEKNIRTTARPSQFQEVPSLITHTDQNISINDFKRQPLLLSQFSHMGPCLTKGDINNDGLEDVFVGGSKDQSGSLFMQLENGSFRKLNTNFLEADASRHDADALFFDANADGFQDLYVSSGGYHNFEPEDPLLQDRLYLGDGKGDFSKSPGSLPKMRSGKSCVVATDLNGDGAQDLFVGGRIVPGRYPETPGSYLLINDGKGNFSDHSHDLTQGLSNIGMVTDAVWTDLNNDEHEDLIVVGEWMPVTVFINKNGKLENETLNYFDQLYQGWWNTISLGDFNNDGNVDLVIGNMGSNIQFRVSNERPAELLYADFDRNGSVDPLFSYYIKETSYPYLTRDELLGQLTHLRSRFTSYESYADAGIKDILSEEDLAAAKKLTVNHLETALFLKTSEGRFKMAELPFQAQYSPVYDISVSDFDKDGNTDMLLFGNNHHFKLRLGKFDANYGIFMKGKGDGSFDYVNQLDSGLEVRGAVRSSLIVNDRLYLSAHQKPISSYLIKPNPDSLL